MSVGVAAPAPVLGTWAELQGTGTRTKAHLGLLIAQLSLLLWAGVPYLQDAAVLAGVALQSLLGWPRGPCWGDTSVLVGVSLWHVQSPEAVTHSVSLAGPVGFQSNNVPLMAGMFTSIGTRAHSSNWCLGLSGVSLRRGAQPGDEASNSWPRSGARTCPSGVGWAGGVAGARNSPGTFPGPQSPGTTGTASLGSASRTLPLWWRRRPR